MRLQICVKSWCWVAEQGIQEEKPARRLSCLASLTGWEERGVQHVLLLLSNPAACAPMFTAASAERE